MAKLTFDPAEGPSQQQKDSEAQPLAQGQKLDEARAQDQEANWDRTSKENDNIDLIGGKFKSQEDLLKAYQELERARSKDKAGETEEVDDLPEGEVEEVEQEASEPNPVFNKAADEYTADGQLSEDSIEELSKMDSKDLIKAYLEFYTKSAQNVSLQQTQLGEIKNIAGGEEGYTELVNWAANNLDQTEIEAFNNVTSSNNYGAIKFAVEALNNRFRSSEGYEPDLVTGGKPANDGARPYRSQAELARDIADPRYSSDPAFRQDIEDRLSKSADLLANT